MSAAPAKNKRTPEQEAYRISRLREAMRKPRSALWKKRQSEGIRKAFAEGRMPPRTAASIEKGAAKLRGRKRPPELVAKIAKANLGKNLFRKATPKTRQAISEGLKRSWETRSPEQREHIRQLGLSHKGKKQDPDKSLIHAIMMWGRKRDPQAVAISSDKMRGRPQRAFLTKKGPTNKGSLMGAIRSPENVIYTFKNLTHFVREHPQLFHPDDVIWRQSKRSDTCRASKGLINLFGKGKFVKGSWKGWTRVSQVEVEYNCGDDLVERPWDIPAS